MLRLLLSRRWLGRHALLLLAVAGFLALGRWQWGRADAGNARSFGYAFEWPLFALFAAFWWWRTLHIERHPPAELPSVSSGGPALAHAEQPAEEPDDELAEYNRYLAWLDQQDQRSAR